MEKIVNVKVDQFRIMFMFYEVDGISEGFHEKQSMDLIFRISEKLNFEEYFGPVRSSNGYDGYNRVYAYGEPGSTYLLAGYSSKSRKNGVSFDFKAVGLEKYLAEAGAAKGKDYQFYDFIKDIKDAIIETKFYMFGQLKLGRYDLAVDFINWNMSLDRIYKKIKSKEYEFYKRDRRAVPEKNNIYGYKKIDLKLDDIRKRLSIYATTETETIYIGDRKKSNGSFLRIYNKYIESYSNGKLTDLTKNQTDWIRYEVELKPDRANGIELVRSIGNIKNNKEYSIWIANSVLDFFRLRTNKGRDTDIARAIEEITLGKRNANPVIERRVDKTIEERKERFKSGNSGFQQLLSDIQKEQGTKGIVDFLKELYDYQLEEFVSKK
ncbi:TPA: replication initiation factor domain-containing protein [Streptococcus suis]